MTQAVARPYWIERDNPVFAWAHGPSREARDLGVILCPPFGYEMLCAHRALRRLAERLANEGFLTLLLDYEGTGDSSGGDGDSDRFSAWLRSIGDGVRDLQARGVSRIALVGLRFGALLAAEYAKRFPVDSLVFVAPPASGRVYLRELRAFQALRRPMPNGASEASEPGDVEEAVGFILTRDSAAQLEKASLVGDTASARRTLIIARDDLTGPEQKLVKQLSALGGTVKLSRAPGYGAMMQEDPVRSVVPTHAWSEIVDFFVQAAESTACSFAPPFERTTARVRSGGSEGEVLEEIVDIDGMFGILCSPVESARRIAPTILLHNVGANHHVGCNRLYVELARRWASLGFSVLRFDLVGIGDTPVKATRGENEVYSGACIADSEKAMQWLAAARGAHGFVLGGICSGAYVSYYAALREPRVQAVMLMNPLTFHWREGDSLDVRMRATLKSTQFYKNAAMEVDTWMRAIRGEVNLGVIARKLGARAWAQASQQVEQWLGTHRETDVGMGFRRLCERGTRIVLACGEDDGSRDVVAEHLGVDARRLRRHSNFRFELVPNTDHTFSPRSAQRDLTERLTSFLTRGDGRSSKQPSHSSVPRLVAWRSGA